MACDHRSSFWSAPGKLKAAVLHSLDGGGSIPDETDEALKAFGLVAGDIEEETAEPFKVYASNWETFQIFCKTWNQWRKVVINNQFVRDGIDWSQVESVLKLLRIKRSKWPMIFEGLGIMQDEALDYLNKGNT